eukprot:9501475-Pyramimonas_sp.AAC.1
MFVERRRVGAATSRIGGSGVWPGGKPPQLDGPRGGRRARTRPGMGRGQRNPAGGVRGDLRRVRRGLRGHRRGKFAVK